MNIVVGMSGGVDSSVAALLLQQQGHTVHGVFMKNWDDLSSNPSYRKEDEVISGCVWKKDLEDAQAVCKQLGIECTTFNFIKEYRDFVFDIFLKELRAGRTPNPDIACNQEIKFQLFLKKAFQLPNIDAIATGHYAKIENGQLCKPKDTNKDQTYFLYRMPRESLKQVIFPLADLTKEEVRAIAAGHNFPNADKKDSTGICFIGDIDYAKFIREHIKPRSGDIQTTSGEVIGQHEGLHFYTIGQRKGINIGGTGPYYVVRKEMKQNVLIVTNNPEDEQLYSSECQIVDMHWLTDVSLPMECEVLIRYRQKPQTARVEKNGGILTIYFDQPQRAVTSGQSAVLYSQNIVLGGGIIQ